MPKLWVDTIEGHRREVRDAILDSTAALVRERGLAAVTMSLIAEETGIGRATLYKYFSEVEEILDAWHERHVDRHLERLAAVRDEHERPFERLQAVLEAFALISFERSREHHGRDREREHAHAHAHTHAARGHRRHAHEGHAADISALVHRSEHVTATQRRLTTFLRDIIADAARSGDVRDDVAPSELALHCLHALSGAGDLPTKSAVARSVAVTLSGLRAQRRK